MAEDAEDRTEEPSTRSLDRAFEEGELPAAKDAPAVAALLAAVATAFGTAQAWAMDGVHALQGCIRALAHPRDGIPWEALAPVMGRGALILCVCAGAALAASMIQTKGGVWPEKVFPDLERVFNVGRLSHMFSKDFVVDLGVSLLKVSALLAAAWWAVGDDLAVLPRLALASPQDAAAAALSFLGRITVACLTVMVVLAVGDSVLGHRRFMTKHRMAREDLKREHKEEEGDPQIKSRRRQRARQLMRERASVTVPTANVILVNPTHIAVAIRYDRAKDRAPKVVAKGADAMAELIRTIAREHSIPIVEDIPLARLLYRTVKVGRDVPNDTFRAVATVLAFVYRITGQQRR